MTTSRLPSPEPIRPPPADSGGLVDWKRVGEHAGFALRSVRRHPVLATLCFLVVTALGPVSLLVMPKTYRVETVVTAERNPVVSTLADPVLRRPFESEDPASAAEDAILRRDNLAALCEETGLVERWQRTRAPAARVRDALVELVTRRKPTHEQRVEALVDRLEKRFTIGVPGAQPGAPPGAPKDRVMIALEWPDAESAKVLVEAAVRRFFETRRERELAMVRDAIGALEIRAAGLEKDIEAKVAQVHQLELGLLRGSTAMSRTYRAPRGRFPQEQELARLRETLESKKLALADLERLRERRAEELRGELARERTIYSEQHPAIARTRDLLAKLDEPSKEAAALRTEIVGLEQDVERASERVARLVDDEDPGLEYRRTELRLLLAEYSGVRDRLDGARVETETARAGFDRRYGFAVPPEKPRKAIWPIPALSIASGLLGGLLLALFAAAVLDVRSGKILERWQIERTVDLPVLGELRG